MHMYLFVVPMLVGLAHYTAVCVLLLINSLETTNIVQNVLLRQEVMGQGLFPNLVDFLSRVYIICENKYQNVYQLIKLLVWNIK